MAKEKAKTPALTFLVPQSREDVDRSIARIGALQRDRTNLHTAKDEELAVIDRDYNTKISPLTDEIRALQQGILTWCEANRTLLTRNGEVKFHNFPSGEVKWRLRPPSVGLRAIDMVLDLLKTRGLHRFIRVKEEVSKDAILAEPDAVAGISGITIKQSEDFVVVPFETKLEEVS
jgi:phage host-nuclease inhibitor protein Gam